MNELLKQLGSSSQNNDFIPLNQEIPKDAYAQILSIRKKPQINNLGNALGLEHAFAIVQFRQKNFFSKDKIFYVACDYGLQISIIAISETEQNKGTIIKNLQIKKNITFQKLKDIAFQYQAEYDILLNNCAHFVRFLQQNLQEDPNQQLVDPNDFLAQQMAKGIVTTVGILAEVGKALIQGLQQAQQQQQQEEQYNLENNQYKYH